MVIQGQIWQCQLKARGSYTYKCSLGSDLVSVTVSKIFRIKGLWSWPLTFQGHPKWSPWAFYIISVGFNIVTLAVLKYSTSKSMTLIFDPWRLSKVKTDGANRNPLGPTYKCSLGIQPRICHCFQEISNQWLWPWPLTSQGHLMSNLTVPIESPLSYDVCWVQHPISHRLATDHPRDQPTNQTIEDSYNVCRNRFSNQYAVLAAWT